MRKVFLFFMLPLLFGCDSQSEHPVASPVKFSVQTDNVTVNKLLPAIKNLLPGLDQYADQYDNIHIEQNYWLTIAFHIPEEANIPSYYLAHGNNCFIEINREGTAIKIPKIACKSVMLDRDIEGLGSDYWFYLNAKDLTYTPYDFSKLNTVQRQNVADGYLKRVASVIDEVQRKSTWHSYDIPNLNRLFTQLVYEGKQFSLPDKLWQPYNSCVSVGEKVNNWWHTLFNSTENLISEDPVRALPALKRVDGSFQAYENSIKDCQKEIKVAPPAEPIMETFPPTSDDKPPRQGCLRVIIKPGEKTHWSCPVKD